MDRSVPGRVHEGESMTLQFVDIDRGGALAIAARVEGLWLEMAAQAAPLLAMITTMHAHNAQLTAELIGPEGMQEGNAFAQGVMEMTHAVQSLQRGTAVLAFVETVEGSERVQHVAVIRRDGIPEGAQLGAWPIVIGVAAVAVSLAAVIVSRFDYDLQLLKQKAEQGRVQMLERIAEKAAEMRATDPQFADRILDFAAAAQAAELDASKNPSGWLERFFASAGSAAGATVPWLLVGLGLWAFSKRRRAA